jgi:hypothetical protein
MRELFDQAAFRAGWRAARSGVPHHENPLQAGALRRFARQWGCGWSAAVESSCRYVSDWERAAA